MKYGVDMAYPPTAHAANVISTLGWSFCGVYVGGPRALSKDAWQQKDGARYPVRDIASYFSEFIPIYVGRNVGDDPRRPWDSAALFTQAQGRTDGDEANRITGACGFGPDTPLFLDVEYGTYQAHPEMTFDYVRGWVERVNMAGHKAGLYSDPVTIQHLGTPDLVDITWCAQWLRASFGTQTPPIGRFDPRTPPAWDMWQFGGSLLAGIQCDLNSCANDIELAKYG